MLKLWHLTVIREVINTGSISKAAQALGRSQPALSLVIADAETHIGYKLFKRLNGRLQPVPEAKFFLQRAEEILEKMKNLERFMVRSANQSFQIRIACMPVLSEIFLPKIIADFATEHKDAHFYLRAQPSARVHESIASQQFDVGFAENPAESELYFTKDFSLPTMIALPDGHPLTCHRVLTPKNLHDVPFSTFLPEHELTIQLRAAFESVDAKLNIPFFLQNAAAQYSVVESGHAVGFMSLLSVWLYQENWERSSRKKVVFRPFTPRIYQNVSLITPRHRPLPQISQLFSAKLEKSVHSILSATKFQFQLDELEELN